MNRRFVSLLSGLVLSSCVALGCQSTSHRPCHSSPAVSAGCATCNAPPGNGPLAPVAAPRSATLQAPYGTVPGRVDYRGYPPPQPTLPLPSWQPPANIRTQGSTAEPPRVGARLQSPDLNTPAQSASADDRATSPALPVGIPQFASVKDQVATGQKPLLDGLDWLKENGFRTVLHLRQHGEDDAAEREQVEKRGMKFLSLEVSPKSLTKAVVDEFVRIVNDRDGYPLFVYDNSGVLVGGLWYLYFRTADRLTDAEARTKASGFGLKEEATGEHRDLWLAIQQFLREQAK